MKSLLGESSGVRRSWSRAGSLDGSIRSGSLDSSHTYKDHESECSKGHE